MTSWRPLRRGLLTLLALPCATLLPGQAVPQYGLRFDSRSAMQWSHDTLMLQGQSSTYMTLPVRRIDDVWPGPVRGSFVVLSEQGLGMLLGPTLGPSSSPFPAGTVLRSSRPDIVIAAVPASGTPGSVRFVEWRTGRRQRVLLSSSEAITDYDVDVAGRIVMLTAARTIKVATGADLRAVPSPPADLLPSGTMMTRIFVDDRGNEITVLAGGDVLRFDVESGHWAKTAFDASRHALVRHMASRRIRIEPRFDVTATR